MEPNGYEATVSQNEAARLLGVTRQALAKRLQRNTLSGLTLAELHADALERDDDEAAARIQEKAGSAPPEPKGRDWRKVLDKEKALKARLERRQLQGTLVPVADVEAVIAETNGIVRQRLEQIGGSVADRLASETDPRRCREIIDAAVREALEELADKADAP